MPLLRTVVVVGAVIALLPSDRAQQERLQQAAIDAAQWTITFCDRNAKTCENAGVAWATFKSKAEFAAGVAYDIAMTHVFKPADHAAATSSKSVETSAILQRGTLTSRDLEPGWRGAQPHREAPEKALSPARVPPSACLADPEPLSRSHDARSRRAP